MQEAINKLYNNCIEEIETYRPKDKDKGMKYDILVEPEQIYLIIEKYFKILTNGNQ